MQQELTKAGETWAFEVDVLQFQRVLIWLCAQAPVLGRLTLHLLNTRTGPAFSLCSSHKDLTSVLQLYLAASMPTKGSVLVLQFGPVPKSYVATSYPHRIMDAENEDIRLLEVYGFFFSSGVHVFFELTLNVERICQKV